MKTAAINPSDKKSRTAYLDVPKRLSRDHPEWFPALQSSVAFDLSRKHPFYEQSEAAFFVAGNSLNPAGRIAVLNNRNFNDYQQTKTAFFTHFDCENDSDAAESLLRAATDWAAGRGLDRLMGPIGFLQTDARGMMVSGYGKMSSFALPYSPPYYAELMQRHGFTKRYDYLSGELQSGFRIEQRVEKAAMQLMQRTKATLHSGSSRKDLRRIAPRLLEIYKESGAKAPLYYPLTLKEEERILEQLYQTVCPRLIHWLEIEKEICGVHMALPNYIETLRKVKGGRLMRTAAFLRQRARPHEINLSSTYLLPEFQGRGLNLIFYLTCQTAALKTGFRRALVGPIYEFNTGKLTVSEKSGVEFNIRHRVFEKEIG